MGFRPEPTTIKLTFASDPDLSGLEITLKSVSVKEFNKMMADVSATGAEAATANDELIQKFADCLVSWNLEDPLTGEPVPTTREGVDTVESILFTRVVVAWQTGLTSVPTKRSTGSTNGQLPDRSVESALDLGSLSGNPGS